MIYLITASAILLLHLGFILFALFGALMAARWRWLLHLPAAGWAVFVELSGRSCPLTVIENHLLMKAGHSGYSESFIEHYLLPIIYPAGLTPAVQWVLAATVIAVNVALYGWLLWRRQGAGRPRR
jgi:hypothetical protein